MPTFIVPDALKQQMDQLRDFRQKQKEATAATAESISGQ